MGGATYIGLMFRRKFERFQSQRRFFGGSNRSACIVLFDHDDVSIAEAILWGEQLLDCSHQTSTGDCFNRRGDSLGGATPPWLALGRQSYMFQSQRRFFGGSNINDVTICRLMSVVSIAEAILWGEQHINATVQSVQSGVSIAEAILWGEQRTCFGLRVILVAVSIAEAILWGEQPRSITNPQVVPGSFNRRGDSLGGATTPEAALIKSTVTVSTAETFLLPAGEKVRMRGNKVPREEIKVALARIFD